MKKLLASFGVGAAGGAIGAAVGALVFANPRPRVICNRRVGHLGYMDSRHGKT